MNHRIKTFIRAIKAARDCLKDSGATYVNVSQIQYGEILRGKKVLVTGGSAGIGFAIARKCLSEGATVVITGRNEEKLESAAQELEHTRLIPLVWDVSEICCAGKKLDEAIGLLNGNLDILVNNAGILDMKPFLDVSEDMWNRIYDTNAKGLFFLSQAASRYWIDNKSGGKILNISSSGGLMGAPHPYRMTKWDVIGLTRGLGVQLYPHGIIVNGIAPGMTATGMVGSKDAKDLHLPDYTPSKRMALPEEIAELALFLLSDASNNIVGQTIVCDGGYSLQH